MLKFLDCTLRDGGYYNAWDFDIELINDYLQALSSLSVEYVELGFRFLSATGFKGACAYTTESFLRQLKIPPGLKLGVMVNASDLIAFPSGGIAAIEKMFVPQHESLLSFVRIAAHIHQFEAMLPCCAWLKEQGYIVGANLMQIADRSASEIEKVASLANQYPIDVLYFADSMGSMDPAQTADIISILRRAWRHDLGIHAHDNMGLALVNTLRAVDAGVTWVDSTVTGMGRGPGNLKTENLMIELAPRDECIKIAPLLSMIEKHFKPLQAMYGWGSNPYYYLAGKYGIHPSFIQEMTSDARYTEEDLLTVINHLGTEGGKNFSLDALKTSRNFYGKELHGRWSPRSVIHGKEVLIIGPGQGSKKYKTAIEAYIRTFKPFVIALNTHTVIEEALITVRAASHPLRLLTDANMLSSLPQALITPASMLPEAIVDALGDKEVFDYGLSVQADRFYCGDTYCILPSPLVFAYALAIATSGNATRILLAGFDGYSMDDPRREEVENVIESYQKEGNVTALLSITPTRYNLPITSVYALL